VLLVRTLYTDFVDEVGSNKFFCGGLSEVDEV
jgi:hypothetical protein